MHVIGQHLDLLHSDWSTFGNLNLEERRLLSARMTRKFVKRSKFFPPARTVGNSHLT